MARQKGMLNLSGNLEPLAGAPLDSRDVTPTVADLYVASNWPYKYIGMKTTVIATGETYRLVNLDVTQESSWVKEGDQIIQYDELPAASSTLAGKIYQYTGTTNLQYTNGYFYECVNDGGTYKWQQTNTQPSSGGGGGGHTIQDDGTDMASRNALNFIGMEVDDNSEDDSTDVSEHRLTSAEISEIMGGIPNPQPRYPVIFDERGTEYKVGWYILANGTKKPVYEKTIKDTMPSAVNTEKFVDVGASIDSVVDIKAIDADSGYWNMFNFFNNTSQYFSKVYATDNTLSYSEHRNKIVLLTTHSDRLNDTVYVAIRYTKTTDTPV